MKEFKDKVAVITGAASGIGCAIAARCAQEEMRVVLADVEEASLNQVEKELKASGARVIGVRTDVSKIKDIENLACKTLEAFGAVHLLFNNAGVDGGSTIWESTIADWEWTIGVNLWGVIHGVRTFVPIMLKQDTECHIVNTASAAGLVAGAGLGVYKVTKHAVVSLSETLCYELAEVAPHISVSVLCPGAISTKIMESGRNRPQELQNDLAHEVENPKAQARRQALHRAIQNGMAPRQVAALVFDGVRENRFYILTHRNYDSQIQQRTENILKGRNPV